MVTQADPAWSEGETIAVSSLNHYLFCPRRCALIHVEGLFAENEYVAAGLVAHERADTPGYEERPGVRTVRALPLYSDLLGLRGVADIVEFRPAAGGEVPYPVDYKHGRRHRWDNDEVQLCAQAFCMEEMLGVNVPAGALFYQPNRRRLEVSFTPELRALCRKAIDDVRAMLVARRVPAAVLKPRCRGCSLRPICLPELTGSPRRVRVYAEALLSGVDE